jgi:sortase A
MTLYVYIKAPVSVEKTKSLFNKNKWKSKIPVNSIVKFAPYAFLISGLSLLLIVSFPFLSYKMLILSKNKNRLISPVSETDLGQKDLLNPAGNPAVLSAEEKQLPPQMVENPDYNLIDSWFPTAPLPRVKSSKITTYNLSIPRLKIKNAIVAIGGREVKTTLIHYPGTALPGEYGNSVIFGHSVLPLFYNPKNYETIFSTIPTLDNGDKIFIYFDGVEYNYEVEDYFEVEPEDVKVLEQRFNEQTLSLVTCVPPGTYKKRGIIKARLVVR